MTDVRTFLPLTGGKLSTGPLDALVAALAEQQHGVVAREQLRELGLTGKMIDGRVGRGLLHRVHRGVYAVGHKRLTKEGRYMAAVLACGEGAVLSGRSAGAHWRIASYAGRITLTAQGRPRQRKNSPFVASCSRVDPADRTEHDGIAITTVSRTLVDLAGALQDRHLETAIREAEFLRIFDLDDLAQTLERNPNAKGRARLVRVVERAAETGNRTRSDLEDLFYDLLRKADLPLPKINELVLLPDRMVELDMAYPDRRLVVELDGWQGHGTRSAFESDRERDLALVAAGWTVVRLTYNALAAGLPANLIALLTQ